MPSRLAYVGVLLSMLAHSPRCAAQHAGGSAWSPERSHPATATGNAAPAPLLPGQWLLDRPRDRQPGDPEYVLRDANGKVGRYIEPTPNVDLALAVGQPVRIRHDTGETLLATQLDLGLQELASGAPRTFRNPRGATSDLLRVQHLSEDPAAPIYLEELPVGNPDPAPVGGPVIAQPPLVTGEMNLTPPAAHVPGPAFGPDCGDACVPYTYSSNPGHLSGEMWRLLDASYWGEITAPVINYAMMPKDRWRIEIGGWTQLGYHSEQTPLSATRGDLAAFNDVSSGLRWQQQWLWVGRQANGKAGPDWGFRFDVVYGTDAQKTQAFGNPGGHWDAAFDHGYYGWALPQFYGEVASDEWTVIFGHFFTPVGYEVVTAPDNFFYSHSLTMFNSEPFTHTGALATYRPYAREDALELYMGYTLGWDTGFDQAFGGSNFVGGWSLRPVESLTIAYVTTIGNLGARSSGGSGYTHSIVADVAVTPRLTYVLQTDYVDYSDRSGMGLRDDQIGVNNYLLYALSPCWGAGARFEWWKTDGSSYYEMTCGLNYRPHPSFVLRPEARYDWSPGGPLAPNRTTLGVDAILIY